DQSRPGLRKGEAACLSTGGQSTHGAVGMGAHGRRRATAALGPGPMGLWTDAAKPQEPDDRARLLPSAGTDRPHQTARRAVRRHRYRRCGRRRSSHLVSERCHPEELLSHHVSEIAVRLILTGDVNLMNVSDATIPFRHVAAELQAADAVFANLECCLHMPSRRSHATEAFLPIRRLAATRCGFPAFTPSVSPTT